MLTKKIMWKVKFERNIRIICSRPNEWKGCKTPIGKMGPSTETEEEGLKVFMDIWKSVNEEALRKSGNRTGPNYKKRKKLIKRLEWMKDVKTFIDKDRRRDSIKYEGLYLIKG